ncbi:hypothetical protein [Phocaeicola sp.]
MLSNTAITNRRGGLNPPEPSVTTLGVMHTVNVIGRIQSAPTATQKQHLG